MSCCQRLPTLGIFLTMFPKPFEKKSRFCQLWQWLANRTAMLNKANSVLWELWASYHTAAIWSTHHEAAGERFQLRLHLLCGARARLAIGLQRGVQLSG